MRMKKILLAMTALAGLATGQAHAGTTPIYLSGAGISGTLFITYGTATNSTYPQALEITGISGTFSDANIGITNAQVVSQVAINRATPGDPQNVGVAPNDFSTFPVTAGLPPINNGVLTYDNLFWPGGAPPTAWDFDGAGEFLDIYGLMFNISGGNAPVGAVVDLFDNGVSPTTGVNSGGFGVAVATSAISENYVAGGVTANLPEPSTWAMLLFGFAGLGFAGYRRSRRAAASAA